MGIAQVKSQNKKMSRSDFLFEKIIGKGSIGIVWYALHQEQGRHYAIKEMNKNSIITHECVEGIQNEREMLSKLRHPFIVNLQYAFQDSENVYLAMDVSTGGNLRYHISTLGVFTESQTKFIVCSIIIILEYLHANGIIHRDIKPENLIFDQKGYLRVTDFGIAQFENHIIEDDAGTPAYMAPEALHEKRIGYSVDYYSLGIIAYECLKGFRPYLGSSRDEIILEMNGNQKYLRKINMPGDWSLEAADFINKLLERNPAQRLGSTGINSLKNHNWLSETNWKKLLEKSIESPINISGEILPNYQNNRGTREIPNISSTDEQNYFEGYSF